MHRPGFSKQHFETAREFLAYLDPLETDRWPQNKFIFRGQPSAGLDLIPSSYRIEGVVSAPKRWGTKETTCGDQVQFEQEVMQRFVQACDSSGFPVPGDNEYLRAIVTNPALRTRPGDWPPREVHHALAFAQHHGVPTCLLDWSRRAHVAAYFAASSALSNPMEDGQRLAIWALNKKSEGAHIVEAPGSTSPNLAAQSGLFTVASISSFHDQRFPEEESPFLPEGLQRQPRLFAQELEPFTLELITVGADQAAELLKSCQLLGVSGATLFPGYEGIAHTLRDWANAEHQGFDPDEIGLRELW
ncbi:FRG domain-containing protein [Salinicola lusitanus]|uniref:FRG domain-containing protein n=1 Tax=Salinicola lusitanus TaxID=1949085 RepID=UPI000DA1827A|nr:FRG domain-containing protein [Salinicola lusitanus]